MSWLSDVWNFEKSALGTEWGQLKKDPERAFIGAIDPASSGVWSGITGKHYSPMFNQLGGPTSNAYKSARADGIDTRAGHGMHKLAQLIALYNVGSYAAGAMGGGAAGGSSSGATNPALIESAVQTPGYGYSSASPGFTGAGAGGGMQNNFQMPQQQQQKQSDNGERSRMLLMAEMLRQAQEQQSQDRENQQMLDPKSRYY